MPVHKYELFKIEINESISKIFTRFTDIINDLKSLRKSYTNSELVHKIFRSGDLEGKNHCHSRSQEPQQTTIRKTPWVFNDS